MKKLRIYTKHHRSLLIALASVMLATFVMLGFYAQASDADGEAHDHTWSKEWAADESYHWHPCTVENCSAAAADSDGYEAHAAEGTCACGGVVVNETNFPDEIFRTYILENVTGAGDGFLTEAELAEVTSLSMVSLYAGKLEGIKFFTSLTKLDCTDNVMSELDVSGLTKLEILKCGTNRISSLNVEGCTSLERLECDHNRLADLDVSTLTALDVLYCNNNAINELDLANNEKLYILDCSSNSLTSLDLSHNKNLYGLLVSYNNTIGTLDISNNTLLSSLYCIKCGLSELDVSSNENLYRLYCDENSLTELDLSNNTMLSELSCGQNSLKMLDISNTAIFSFTNSPQTVDIEINQVEMTYTMPEGFDIEKVSDVTGGSFDGNVLTVEEGAETASYSYAVATDSFSGTMPVTLNITNPHTHAAEGACSCGIVMIDAVSFPDANFRNAITTKLAENGADDGILTPAELEAVEHLDVKGTGVSDLTGIEYFSSLLVLTCSENNLTELDLSRNTKLQEVSCSLNSQLTELTLASEDTLEVLTCSNTALTELDLTGYTALTELSAVECGLTYLKLTGCSGLNKLVCTKNQLEVLDLSDCQSLTFVDCGSNSLTSLDVSNLPLLTMLYCNNNNLTELNVENATQLQILACGRNQLTALNLKNNTALTSLMCLNNNLQSIDLSNNTSLSYLDLYSNTSLSDLDLSNNQELTYLDCSYCNLSSLDLSSNVKLAELYCIGNQLTHLDITNNPALTNYNLVSQTKAITIDDAATYEMPEGFDSGKVFDVTGGSFNGSILSVDAETSSVTYSYKVTGGSIDDYLSVSLSIANPHSHATEGVCACGAVLINETNFPDANFRSGITTKLESYGADDGVMTSAELASVKTLRLTFYEIQSLQGIEFFTALQYLFCNSNNISALDLSQNTELQYLYCNNNNISALDLSKNTKLLDLMCGYNPLTELDISNHESLVYLDVSYCTTLSSLNVSGCVALSDLYCSGNFLQELDLSGISLTRLDCDNNKLKSLDLTDSASTLETLFCFQNKIESLDISSNTLLTQLKCYNNSLTSLDVSKNTGLTTLDCSSNCLTELDLSNNSALTSLTCGGQVREIEIVQKTSTYEMPESFVSGNVTEVSNGSFDGNVLTVEDATPDPCTVTYKYTVSGGSLEQEMDVTLQISNPHTHSYDCETTIVKDEHEHYLMSCVCGKGDSANTEAHTYTSGVCSGCGYACLHSGTHTDGLCDECGVLSPITVTVDGVSYKVDTLIDAFEKAEEGTAESPVTITLWEDISYTDDSNHFYMYGGVAILELNGKKISLDEGTAYILPYGGADLTINDSSEEKTGGIYNKRTSAFGTIVATESKITINGGTIYSASRFNCYFQGGCEVIQNGGTISNNSNLSYPVYLKQSSYEQNEGTVENTTNSSYCIYVHTDSSYVQNGGAVNGYCGAYLFGGDYTMNAGTVTVGCGGFAFGENSNLTINGGTVNMGDDVLGEGALFSVTEGLTDNTVAIKGGTFYEVNANPVPLIYGDTEATCTVTGGAFLSGVCRYTIDSEGTRTYYPLSETLPEEYLYFLRDGTHITLTADQSVITDYVNATKCAHEYDSFAHIEDNYLSGKHMATCSICSFETDQECTYDSECHEYCNVCHLVTREVDLELHTRGNYLETPNSDGHSAVCGSCGITLNEYCTYTHPCQETCDYCSRDYADKVEHTVQLVSDGEGKHDKICEVCEKVIDSEVDCVYNEVVADEYLRTPANCLNLATYYKSCDCGHAGEEYFEHGETNPDSHVELPTYTQSDGDGHVVSYECCGASAEEECYVINADGNCLTQEVCDCGRVMTEAREEHSYVEYSHDENSHWQKCDHCDAVSTKSYHEGSGSGDCTKDVTCVCGYVVSVGNETHPDSDGDFVCDQCYNTFGLVERIGVSLGQDISMRYYVTTSVSSTAPQVRFTINNYSKTVSGTLQDGYYVYIFDGVAPQCIGDNVCSEIIVNGEVVETRNYSVYKYLDSIFYAGPEYLGMTGAKFSAMQTLIYDLLAYGSAAQTYTGHNVDNLVNTSYTSGATEFVELEDTDKSVRQGEYVTFTSATVFFDSTNSLRFRFKTDSTENLTFKLKINDGEETEVSYKADGDVYMIETDPIYATGFDDVYTLTAYKDGVADAVTTYSVESYVYSKQSGTTAMAELAKALYNYGLSAKAYVATE